MDKTKSALIVSLAVNAATVATLGTVVLTADSVALPVQAEAMASPDQAARILEVVKDSHLPDGALADCTREVVMSGEKYSHQAFCNFVPTNPEEKQSVIALSFDQTGKIDTVLAESHTNLPWERFSFLTAMADKEPVIVAQVSFKGYSALVGTDDVPKNTALPAGVVITPRGTDLSKVVVAQAPGDIAKVIEGP
jgi:hypothetical protein